MEETGMGGTMHKDGSEVGPRKAAEGRQLREVVSVNAQVGLA